MRTREEWFDAERLKAKKYEITRNATGMGFVTLIGVQWADDLIPSLEMIPNDSPIRYVISALGGFAAVASYSLHREKRKSESSSLKAAAYEVTELKDIYYEPGDWATSALAQANLTADEIAELPYGSVVKPKRIS